MSNLQKIFDEAWEQSALMCGCFRQLDYVCEYHVALTDGLDMALELIRNNPNETFDYIGE